MRILGIDPGSRITGYGIIEKTGNRLQHLASGCISTDSRAALGLRLQAIYEQLTRLIAEWQPEVAAIEKVFLASNPQSALVLGHARGAAMLAAVNAGLSVSEYSALQIKSAVVGYGRAAKPQVQQMVKALLNLQAIVREDASDALGVAICHAHSSRLGDALTRGAASPTASTRTR